jgi:histidinol-phosphate aminotransferase
MPPAAVRLNVNENPYAPPPQVRRELSDAVAHLAGELNRYPDQEFLALRGALAEYLGREADAPWLTARHMWAGNGSNEVMLHVFQAFGGPGRTAMSLDPTYSMYPHYARDTHTGWVTAPRRSDFRLDLPAALETIDSAKPSIVLLASPNNPTGTALQLDEVEALAQATLRPDGQAQAVVVIDEAYAEFRRPGTPSAVPLVAQYPHLAVTRTMSKAFAWAGVRLGYMAASAELTDALRLVRLPYHLSALTQAAGLVALRQADALLAAVAQLRQARDQLVRDLQRRINPATGRNLDVAESDANFVLFGRFADRHAMWEQMAGLGVAVRETGPDGWLRVSVGTPQDNAAFLTALDQAMEAQQPPAMSSTPPPTGGS